MLITDEIKHAWLHDLFIYGGLVPATESRRDKDYACMYNDTNYVGYSQGAHAAEIVCNFILQRTFNFKEVDEALTTLSTFEFGSSLVTPKAGPIHLAPATLAEIVADFCHKNHIFWDDSFYSAEEFNIFISDYFSAAALAANKCFTTQEEDTNTPLPATATATPAATNNSTTTSQTATASESPTNTTKPASTATATPATTAAHNGPKIGYKTMGAQSANIPNLIGNPGDKIFFTNNIFTVIADNPVGKNTPAVYITPLKVTAQGTSAVTKQAAEKIKFASGNGYTDCQLFFEDSQEADYMLQYLESGGILFKNMHVVQVKPDSNGYFKVSTEAGAAYIKASKLNEEYINECVTNKIKARTALKEIKNTIISEDDFDIWDDIHNKD